MQGFDFRVVLPEPLLHQSLVALLRTVQGLLASDAKLRQQSTNRIGAHHDPKLMGISNNWLRFEGVCCPARSVCGALAIVPAARARLPA